MNIVSYSFIHFLNPFTYMLLDKKIETSFKIYIGDRRNPKVANR